MADEAPRKLFAGAGMAALRQGGKELATAITKAFPDSISIEEPGGVLSPTQGEIAQQNRAGSIWERVQDGRERAAVSKETPEIPHDRE